MLGGQRLYWLGLQPAPAQNSPPSSTTEEALQPHPRAADEDHNGGPLFFSGASSEATSVSSVIALQQFKSPVLLQRLAPQCWIIEHGNLQPSLVNSQEECNGVCNWRLHFRPLCDLHFGDWRIHVSYVYGHEQRLGRVLEPGDFVLAEKRCLEQYKFSHGDVILFKCPSNHKQLFVKRLIGLPGEWMQLPGSLKLTKIPEGHCWVEGDNSARSWDSRAFGPIPLGLVQGRVTHIIWPPSRTGRVERKIPEGRISPD